MNSELAESNKRLAGSQLRTAIGEDARARGPQRPPEPANDELSRSNLSLENEIRERIRAETSLKEAVVKRDEFLAMLSHELRNPLSPLRNASHMLMQGETRTRRSSGRAA